ncbi:Zinc transporter 2 [Aphelenchoides bicaudatus]|nr:Zinc transporter 2 [Aphelenchoides bicaudatus]
MKSSCLIDSLKNVYTQKAFSRMSIIGERDGERRRLISVNGTDEVVDYGSQHSGSGSDGFHCHELSEEQQETKKRAIRVLWMSVVVCLFFMICEVIGGWWAGSLAIITDAAHLLTDLASMLISLFSLYLASRPASQRMSFGWHRAEVVGAFISVFMIWVVTGVLVYLAIDRIVRKEYEIQSTVMAITAGIGVCVNLVMGLLLYYGGHGHSHGGLSAASHSHSHEAPQTQSVLPLTLTPVVEQTARTNGHDVNINVRAAFIHVLGDMIQSVGVLIAALIILWNKDWAIVDPICTLLFSVIVGCTTVYIVRDALVVLLEGRPSSIDFRMVFDALEKIEGVRKVHDLRIWALTMNRIALSAHLEVDQATDAQLILKTATIMLRKQFGVHETTIQIEDYQQTTENCFQCVPPVQ